MTLQRIELGFQKLPRKIKLCRQHFDFGLDDNFFDQDLILLYLASLVYMGGSLFIRLISN